MFLLSALGTTLSVLVTRLGRVVDRFRSLEALHDAIDDTARAAAATEMARLRQRARMVHWAIGLCTCSALLVCIVIATLFVGSVTGLQVPMLIAILFIGVMLALVAGLLCFLREITLAQGSIHTLPR